MDMNNTSWHNTKEVLGDLKQLLVCAVCNEVVKAPLTLGGCEHFFCRECVADMAGGDCPQCGLPSHMRDVQTNRQLASAVKLCQRLQLLLQECDDDDGDGSVRQVEEPMVGSDHPDDAAMHDEVRLLEEDDDTIATTVSPPSRRTRRGLKQQRRRAQVAAGNASWAIGRSGTVVGSAIDKCNSCRRSPHDKRVQFRGEKPEQPDFTEDADSASVEIGNGQQDKVGSLNSRDGVGKDCGGTSECVHEKVDDKYACVTRETNDNVYRWKIALQGPTPVKKGSVKEQGIVEGGKENSDGNRAIKRKIGRKTRLKERSNDVVTKISRLRVNECEKAGEVKKESGEDEEDCTRTDSDCDTESDFAGKSRMSTSKKAVRNLDRTRSHSQSTASEGTVESERNLRDRRKIKRSLSAKSSPKLADGESDVGDEVKRRTRKAGRNAVSLSPRNRRGRAAEDGPVVTQRTGRTRGRSVEAGSRAGRLRQQQLTPKTVAKAIAAQPWMTPTQTTSQAMSTPTRKQPLMSTPGSNKSTPRLRRSVASSPAGSSPAVKKNAKGETALHIACIKGDIEKVRSLLAEGAAVNVKDNAGWTPLHEAVNHGHEAVARELLKSGAHVNTPGGGHDTPLHDAVANRHVKCARLLVAHGADTQARNSCGKTVLEVPEASAPDMQAALNAPRIPGLVTSESEAAASEAIQEVVVLATGLSREERATLSRCAALIHAQTEAEFSPAVTHLVTSVNSAGQCPRTLKYLQAVLAGRWVVNMTWVETCLEYSSRVPEEAFEVPGTSQAPDSLAPARSRKNNDKQLPPLFSGCHFFLRGDFEYPTPSRNQLAALIKIGGGVLLSREPRLDLIQDSDPIVPYHADPNSELANCSHYIVDASPRQPSAVYGGRLCEVPASWLMDSISRFSLLPV